MSREPPISWYGGVQDNSNTEDDVGRKHVLFEVLMPDKIDLQL